ncbi:MAG: enoyl-CoA hydratase [Caulobacter sp.]|nr:enoyl-CoA hydratase [Caulobacter sp.]
MTDVTTEEPEEVIVKQESWCVRLTLNRPKALHALNTNMCRIMIEALLHARDEPAVELIVIDHAGGRGFCAGGDIRMLAESGAGDSVEAREFFFTEYRLNALLQSYPKPVVVFMDGVTMGGGVGLSLPAKYRIASENTVFAMPETGIGLFPDVGGGWYLPRLPGKAGLWLALTGARIKGADCVALGIATHFIESAQYETLKPVVFESYQNLDVLLSLAEKGARHETTIDRAAVDLLFSGESVEDIFAALEADGSEWAAKHLAVLKTKSPQTLKVAFRQLQHGAALTRFADNMAMEYRIGARVVQRHDFLEGVRAVIIDKDNAPQWNPATLEDVTDALLDDIFAPLPPADEWTPLP